MSLPRTHKGMGRPAWIAAGLLLVTARVAGAQQAPGAHNIDLGVRLGYGVPFGNVGGDPGRALDEILSGHVPVVLEGGYRLTPPLTLGVYAQYGFAQVKETTATGCGQLGTTCSGSVVRLGVQALYRLDALAKLMPWLGAGFGYEWINVDGSGVLGDASLGVRGFEVLNLQLGGDIVLNHIVALGPFISFSFARFETSSVGTGGNEVESDLNNKRFHEWLQLGVRGAFSL